MKKYALLAVALLSLLTAALIQPEPASAASSQCTSPVSTWSVARRVEQLLMVSGQFSNLAASASEASAGVGGFVFFGQPPAGSGPSIRAGISALNGDAANSGVVSPWMSTDEEGGYVARLSYVIGSLPTPRYMATYWSPGQVQNVLANHAAAMRSLGINMDLAPVLDTASPYNTIADMSDRSFSENGNVAATYGMAYTNGLRLSAVVPVLKHFPGIGHASANTDLSAAVDPSLSTLQTNDLIPFTRAISYGLPVVMVSHAQVPGLSGTTPASLSSATYSFLRNNLQFQGVAMTDSLGAGAISGAGYSQPAAAVTAVRAGADMVIIDASQWQATLAALEQAVSAGSLSLGSLNASVARIVATKGFQICPSNWTPLGGIVVGSVGVSSWAPGRLDLFVRGTDDGMYHRWSTDGGNTWSGWESLGGTLTSAPAAVSWGFNRIDVFIRGSDRALWHKWWDGTGWHGWESLGGVLTSDPTVASFGANRLDVFARGTDNATWHRWYNFAGWHPWESMGGVASSAPAAVSPGLRIDLFIRGTDNAAWHRYWDSTGWHPWESLGGILASSPSAASPAAQQVDMYGLAVGNVLDYRFWNGTGWNAWQAVDGNIWTRNPGAVTGGANILDLFERGLDGGVWFRTTSGS